MPPGPPSFGSYYLFEDPWPGLAVAGIAVLVLLILARRRSFRGGGKRLLIAAGAVVVAAGLFALMAHLVHTPRERLEEQARRLVELARDPNNDQPGGPGGPGGLRGILLFGADVVGPDGGLVWDYPQLLARLDSITRGYKITRHSVQAIDAQVDPTGNKGQTEITVRTYGDLPTGDSIASRWMIEWVKDKNGVWRASRLQCLSIGGRKELADSLREAR